MQVDESMNEQVFKAMVMQTIVSKFPHSMPSFDHTNLISTVEKHDIENREHSMAHHYN